MKCADAAAKLLTKSGGPLHYTKIAKEIQYLGWWRSRGKTPDTTVDACLSRDARFIRMDIGVYDLICMETRLLRDIHGGKSCAVSVRGPYNCDTKPDRGFRGGTVVSIDAGLACVISAWERLARHERQSILDIVEAFQKRRKVKRDQTTFPDTVS